MVVWARQGFLEEENRIQKGLAGWPERKQSILFSGEGMGLLAHP